MVAVVSSNELGLFDSSMGQLGAVGQQNNAGIGQAGSGVYVNAASGNLVVQRIDDNIQGLGIDASLLRTYNSQGELDGDNNDGWRMGLSRKIDVGSGLPVRTTSGGGTQSFELVSTNNYQSTAGSGAHDSLIKNTDGSWTYTEGSSGLIEHYRVDGRLDRVTDRNGKGIKVHYFDESDSTSHKISYLALDTADGLLEYVYFDYNLSNNPGIRGRVIIPITKNPFGLRNNNLVL